VGQVSTARSTDLPAKRRGPNGERLCRWCGEDVPKGRLEWCSEECVNEYKIKANPGYARSLVHQRDKGVCAICRLDCRFLEKWRDTLRDPWRSHQSRQWIQVRSRVRSFVVYGSWGELAKGMVREAPFGKPIGPTPTELRDRSLWHADHIKPVVEGGGECGLDNLRTLCLWCHKLETRKLRRRMKKQK